MIIVAFLFILSCALEVIFFVYALGAECFKTSMVFCSHSFWDLTVALKSFCVTILGA